MSALSPRQLFLLDEACKPIAKAFDHYPYLVGTATEKQAYRDVDVRLILEDAKYDVMHDAVGQEAIVFLGFAIGQYLADRTGLPIDFQFQRRTEANEKHHSKRRNPLGIRELSEYKGDAPVVQNCNDQSGEQ